MVTQHYPPELLGSAPYCEDIARWIAARGDGITVLTGLPAYPDPARFASFRAHAPRGELRHGAAIERLRHWAPAGGSAAARIGREVMFFLAGIGTLVTRRVRRERLVISLCPSILSVALGSIACRRGGRHVTVVHDIQSGLAGGLGIVGSPFIVRLMRVVERMALNRAHLIIALTREMRDELRLLGVRAPIAIVPIWGDVDEIVPRPNVTADSAFIYSGNLGRKQGISQIIDFASELRRRRPELEIVLRGAGNQEGALETALRESALDNVRREEPLPPERLGDGLAAGRIHIVPQEPDAAAFAMPSKVIAIMSAARPIIATARAESPLWRLGRDSRSIVCVPPNDPARLADAALRLIDKPLLCAALGRRARLYVERHRAKRDLLASLEDLLTYDDAAPADSVLIIEPLAEGHPREWLQHLARQAALSDGPLLWLVVAPELARSLARELPADADHRVRIVPLGKTEARLSRSPWLAVSALARWWSLARAVRRTGAGAAHALYLDHLALPLALGFGLGRCRLSGILFRPSVHYGLLGARERPWRESLRDWRKALLYRAMLRNRTLASVLTLDPYFARYAAKAYRGGGKVSVVDDPTHPKVDATEDDRALALTVPHGRRVFVLFGHLTERKGTLALLDALARLEPSTASRIAVVLAGRIDPTIARAVDEHRAALAKAGPALFLHVEDRLLRAGEIEALVERADVILAPYQRFIGPSGVLLWAARAGKPVLTQDYGLIGTLARHHRLGLAIDTTRADAIADGIARLARDEGGDVFNRDIARRYAANQTPQSFADTVLASLARA